MTEFANPREEIERFKEKVGVGIENALVVLTTGQENELPIDSSSLGIDNLEEPALTIDERIAFRDTLYRLIGRSTVEKTTPIATYNASEEGDYEMIVSVFEGSFPDPETEELVPIFLHETVDRNGGYSWVISNSTGRSSFFIGDNTHQEVEKDEGFVKDEIIEMAAPTLEYSLTIANLIKKIYPEYSELNSDQFKKNGRICIFKKEVNEDGLHMAINMLASPTSFGYILGFVEMKKGKPVFKYKNLPRIVETQTTKGIQLDHPQTDWEFTAENNDKRIRSFNEMEGVLDLLREHGQF